MCLNLSIFVQYHIYIIETRLKNIILFKMQVFPKYIWRPFLVVILSITHKKLKQLDKFTQNAFCTSTKFN